MYNLNYTLNSGFNFFVIKIYMMRNYYRNFKRHLPEMSFLVSSTAFLFQINILNPWHDIISKQINKIEKKLT